MLTSNSSLIATLTDPTTQNIQTFRDMLGLPLDVYRHIRGFVHPVRDDWWYCKAHEANLIWEELIWRRETRAIAQRGRTVEEAEEARTWSLYGILILERIYIGGYPPLVPPSEAAYQDDPRGWYRHRLMWVSDGGE